MSQKTSVKPITPLIEKVNKGVGFFQINLQQFKKIANSGLGPNAMSAYLVLAGGVDSTEKDIQRASTHGVKSIMTRTAIKKRRVEDAVRSLVEKGFLVPPATAPANRQIQPGKKAPVLYAVDPESSCDICISQDFLQAFEKGPDGHPEFKRETLGYLIHEIETSEGGMRALNAIVDALLVYVCLHNEQDFDCFGGVNPKIAHGRFLPIDPDEDGDGSLAVQAVAGVKGWTWFRQKRTDDMVYSPEFITQTLGGAQTWANSPALEIRFNLAIKQLEKSGLIYRSVVLWNRDPLSMMDGYPLDPEVTLQVGNRRDPSLEMDVEVEVIKALQKMECIDRSAVFNKNGELSKNWTNSNYFHNIVPNDIVSGMTLLTQLRVHRWGGTESNFESLKEDAERTLKWRARLQEMTDSA